MVWIWQRGFIGESKRFDFIGRSDVEDVDGDVVGGHEDWNIVMDSGWKVDVGSVEFIFVLHIVGKSIRIVKSRMNVCENTPEEAEVVVIFYVDGGCTIIDFSR